MLTEAYDFRDESEALYKLLEPLDDADYELVTLFKEWTINDVLRHLHFFNYAADLTRTNEEEFKRVYAEMSEVRTKTDSLTIATNEMLKGLKGKALLKAWREYYLEMAEKFYQEDPKRRLIWVGPSMSARSSISARLMETWSHGQEVYDVLGVERENTDRIRSIVVIGMNTFNWTFINRKEAIPGPVPHVRITAPSGAIWEWNPENENDSIEGDAAEFCQVVAQTRNIADTKLRVQGPVAERWMSIAQCFAGVPRTPPAPGTRYKNPVPFTKS